MTTDRLDGVREALRAFAEARDWGQFHDPKNLAMAIASEAGELLAEFRWVANDASDDYVSEPEVRDRVADEVADVGITLLLLCDRVGIDLIEVMNDKIARNEQRYPAGVVRGDWRRPGGD